MSLWDHSNNLLVRIWYSDWLGTLVQSVCEVQLSYVCVRRVRADDIDDILFCSFLYYFSLFCWHCRYIQFTNFGYQCKNSPHYKWVLLLHTFFLFSTSHMNQTEYFSSENVFDRQFPVVCYMCERPTPDSPAIIFDSHIKMVII